jgi:hypothetical protein
MSVSSTPPFYYQSAIDPERTNLRAAKYFREKILMALQSGKKHSTKSLS